MGQVEYSERGADLNRLNDMMRRFVLEYPVDYNGARAVIAAGYSKKGATVTAVRLLKHPVIKKILGKQELQSRKRLEATSEEILEQLAYCATRSGADYMDKQGILIQNVHDLPERAQQAIDGIKQKVTRYTLADGTNVEEVETEFKIVSKLGAIRTAMEHKGLFAPQQHDHKISIDLDALLGRPEVIDNVESRLIEEEHNAER